MTRLLPPLAAVLPLLCAVAAAGPLDGPLAYSQPSAGLTAAERPAFYQGRALFRQMWVIPPSRDEQFDGLGPLYNRPSCASCHPGNGRGRAPDGPQERMLSMLVRLSIPGDDGHGGPRPDPLYGGQLNEEGVPGVPGEGRATIRYDQQPLRLDDGTVVPLRRPRLTLEGLGYGPPGEGLMRSPRVGPAVFGLGALEAVPEAAIIAWADPDDRDGDGISGRPNRVWDVAAGRPALGRFGYKANVPTLRQQIAGAFVGDLGITSPLYPAQNCTAAEAACRHSPAGGDPELSAAQLDAITRYLRALAVPPRRHPDDPAVRRGEGLFHAAGCAACHRPALPVAGSAEPIAPYSDLLLHDLGEGLADGRPDYLADGREWRTAPLWGIGLAEVVSGPAGYLHDGRARTPLEAILWHDGEAAAARRAVTAMEREAREALLAFLGSL